MNGAAAAAGRRERLSTPAPGTRPEAAGRTELTALRGVSFAPRLLPAGAAARSCQISHRRGPAAGRATDPELVMIPRRCRLTNGRLGDKRFSAETRRRDPISSQRRPAAAADCAQFDAVTI